MKALSINQPWAWLIVNGYKCVENRDWDTRYRGEFLIHAGKKIDESAYGSLHDMGVFPPYPDEIETGGIVGKARLINTIHIREKHLVTSRDKPWFFGTFGFMLDGAEPCDLKPCKGALGFFEPDYSSRYKDKPIKEPRAPNPLPVDTPLPLFAEET